MSDLQTHLDRLAGTALPPPTSTVDADLARGRRALRRRRAGRYTAGAGLVVAAVTAAALILPGAFAGNDPATGNGTAQGTGSGTAQGAGNDAATSGARLVDYTGKQPAAFTLDQVPEGWQVQGADDSGLTLAPKNTADKDPHSFAGKIAIMLSPEVPADVKKQDVLVGDRPGILATMIDQTDGRTLFVKQPSGAYLTIQVWDGLGWNERTIVQFATGVHVNDGAQVTAG
jgi:hypothetical protein